jgi:hypothetical protein
LSNLVTAVRTYVQAPPIFRLHPAHCFSVPFHINLDKRLELVHSSGLHLPSVGLVTLGEVLGRLLIALEQPLEPVELDLAELAAVVAEEVTTVAKVEVALPRGCVGREGLEVALSLWEVVSVFLR